MSALIFYPFAIIMILSALGVITSRNPVHSVLFLILTFFNAAVIFLTLGAEFIAMLLVIVYVGAVAVLLLFVVMMLDIHLTESRQSLLNYVPIGIGIALTLLFEIIYGISTTRFSKYAKSFNDTNENLSHMTNIEAIGNLLYTKYTYIFQLSGIILLVSIIGAIVLTLRHRNNVKRQNIFVQNNRTRANTLEIKKVPFGRGI